MITSSVSVRSSFGSMISSLSTVPAQFLVCIHYRTFVSYHQVTVPINRALSFW
nr:MAG TPA: hypothetical protein [Caudoviricetes sp.]